MLGGCAIRYGDKVLDDSVMRSKKIWTMLEYLLAFHTKSFTQEELITLIYPGEDNDNPGNALKAILHRTRGALESLGLPGGKGLLLQRRGAYIWNPVFTLDIDVEKFEELCKRGETAVDPEERLQCFTEAIALYGGDYLPKSAAEPWVMPLNTYYHSLYLRTVHSAVELLVPKKQDEQIVDICKKAIEIDRYDEFLYYHLIESLANMKCPQAAMEQYESMTKLFYDEFGVTPSKELRALYKQLVKTGKSVETDLSIVKEYLREQSGSAGAFCCEYAFFKDIYQLEVRSTARSGIAVHLGLLTLVMPDGSAPGAKSLANAMEKLSETIRLSLRRGDVYARYSVSQYVILLPGTDYENGLMVLERIRRRFRHDNPRILLKLDSSLQAIDAELK